MPMLSPLSSPKKTLSRPAPGSGDAEEEAGAGWSPATVRLIGETRGIAGMSEPSAQAVASHVTSVLRSIIQESVKCSRRGRRHYMTGTDLDTALVNKGVEPVYGCTLDKLPNYRFVRGGGRDIHFPEETEIELRSLVTKESAKVPYECGLKTHWLVIDGQQPAVPENPPPNPLDPTFSTLTHLATPDSTTTDPNGAQSTKTTHPINGARRQETELKPRPLRDLIAPHSTSHFALQTRQKPPAELALVKEVRTHELSREQQIYFREITEACVGTSEERRQEALDSLSADSGLHQLLPRLITFIAEGVRANTVTVNLAILIYLMRMIQCILENPYLHLEKYLHRLVPTVVSCIVCKQLCVKPEADNHWALRDFAAKHLAIICNKYTTPTNQLMARVTDLLLKALLQDTQAGSATSLVTMYGGLVGLCSLGHSTIASCLLPILSQVTSHISDIVETQGVGIHPADAKAIEQFRTVMTVRIAPVLSESRPGPIASLETYRSEFRCMGVALHSAITNLRKTPTTTAPSLSKPWMTSTTSSAPSTPVSLKPWTSASMTSHPVVSSSSAGSLIKTNIVPSLVSASPVTSLVLPVSSSGNIVMTSSNPTSITASGILFNRSKQPPPR